MFEPEADFKPFHDAVKYDTQENNGNGFVHGAEIEIKNKKNNEITKGKFHGIFGYDTFTIAPNDQPNEPKTLKKSDFLFKIVTPNFDKNTYHPKGGKTTYRKTKKSRKNKSRKNKSRMNKRRTNRRR